MSNISDVHDGSPGTSFEERSAWVQFLSLLLCLGGYAHIAWRMWSAGVTALPAYAAVFAVSTVLLVIVIVVGHVVIALANREHGRDERDRLIEWRAESYSGWVLGAGVVTGLWLMVIETPDVWVAHLLLFSLFASELLRLARQIGFYRRGV
jgi:hypothetical protein